MNVLCHQHISMDKAARASGIFPQPLEINQIILSRVKTGLPIISTLNDMEGNIGHNNSGSSWHKTTDNMIG